jgi:hypothetical protein
MGFFDYFMGKKSPVSSSGQNMLGSNMRVNNNNQFTTKNPGYVGGRTRRNRRNRRSTRRNRKSNRRSRS